jgi:hypothetical protein
MPVVGFLRSMTSADFRQGLRTARSNTAGPTINRRWSPICHAGAPGSGASGGRREAHSMRDSAQVTAPGAVTSMIVAVSTRANRQNRSTCSRMSGPLVQNQMLRLVDRLVDPRSSQCARGQGSSRPGVVWDNRVYNGAATPRRSSACPRRRRCAEQAHNLKVAGSNPTPPTLTC